MEGVKPCPLPETPPSAVSVPAPADLSKDAAPAGVGGLDSAQSRTPATPKQVLFR